MDNELPLVLFLCTGNSARSQMADALLRHKAADRFRVASAGLDPASQVNPLTHAVMSELDIDTSGQHPKHAGEFLGRVNVRHAIIVCAAAQQHCPRFYPFTGQTHSWPFEDPAACVGPPDVRLAKFREVRDLISARIDRWLAELTRP